MPMKTRRPMPGNFANRSEPLLRLAVGDDRLYVRSTDRRPIRRTGPCVSISEFAAFAIGALIPTVAELGRSPRSPWIAAALRPPPRRHRPRTVHAVTLLDAARPALWPQGVDSLKKYRDADRPRSREFGAHTDPSGDDLPNRFAIVEGWKYQARLRGP